MEFIWFLDILWVVAHNNAHAGRSPVDQVRKSFPAINR